MVRVGEEDHGLNHFAALASKDEVLFAAITGDADAACQAMRDEGVCKVGDACGGELE
jgi:hypothetical protein